MKTKITFALILCIMLFSPLFWRGVGGEVSANNITQANIKGQAGIMVNSYTGSSCSGQSKKNTISREEAKVLLGQDYLGPEAIEKAFGIIPINIPEIPFTFNDLQRAKELKMVLILQMDQIKGEPFTIKKMLEITKNSYDGNKKFFCDTMIVEKNGKKVNLPIDWFKGKNFYGTETPRFGWKLVSKDIIPGSGDRSYIQNDNMIISYYRLQFRRGEVIPKEHKKAIMDFYEKEERLDSICSLDYWSLGRIIKEPTDLKLHQIFRESCSEVIYRMILYQLVNNIFISRPILVSTSTIETDNEQFTNYKKFVMQVGILSGENENFTHKMIMVRQSHGTGGVCLSIMGIN